MEVPRGKKRVRDDPDQSRLASLEVKRLRDDLLEFLDDADPVPLSPDLDSVMKSLQEEISGPVVDLTSDSGESPPQIGYLLEASDDELGLPPASASSGQQGKNEEAELIRVSSDSSGIGEFWEFEYQITSHDSFESGAGIGYDVNTEYVAFDGLFDHSEVNYDTTDFSESWRHENMPSL